MILHVIRDLTTSDSAFVLAQHGVSYKIYSREIFENESEEMLSSATEENCWNLWYNQDFVEVE